MTAQRLAAIFCAVFFAMLIARLPLAVPLALIDAPQLTSTRAVGSVWDGQIQGLAWRGRVLGDAAVRVRPLMLLLGRADIDGALAGSAVTGAGRITLWPNASTEVRDAVLTADVAMLPLVLPLKGTLTIDARRLAFGDEGCRAVDASVTTDTLAKSTAGISWQGPVLAGNITCTAGTLMVPLAGTAGNDSVAVTLQLSADGGFQVKVDARTANENLKRMLSTAGFNAVGDGMTLIQNGRWTRG